MSNNIQLNDEAAALYSKGEIDAFADLYADDAVLRSPDGEYQGKQAIREYWTQQKAGFPDGTVEMIRSIADGDVVMGEWKYSGTNTGALQMPDGTEVPATGKSFESSGAEMVRFQGDKIVEHNLYFDNLAGMVQLGLIPEA